VGSSAIEGGRLSELLDGFRGRRVAILGDAMLDRYIWGDVNRISPEAPVPVVEVCEETVRFGGAANVAENVATLGATADVVGVIGDDDHGRSLVQRLAERGVAVDHLIRVAGRPTTTKTRIIAHNQQVVRADREHSHAIEGEEERALVTALEGAVRAADVLIISDYGKGVVTERTLAVALEAARTGETKVCVDPKQSHFSRYLGVTAITPNLKEASGAVGYPMATEDELLRGGWELRDRLDAECVIVTRGEQGMSLFMRGGDYEHLPTVAREVYDVTGAGDTVVSVLGVALAAGASMVEAAIIANHAAGIVIREIGTASVTTDDIRRSVEQMGEAAGG